MPQEVIVSDDSLAHPAGDMDYSRDEGAHPYSPAIRNDLQIKRRFLPHWRMEGAWYFVTFNVWRGSLSRDEIVFMREHVVNGSGKYYYLCAVSVMPDHVRIILSPSKGYTLSRITHGIKGVSARLINLRRGSYGRLWQVESWDRILRDDDELNEKLGYLLQNPVEAGLTEDPWSWCGWYLDPSPMKGTG